MIAPYSRVQGSSGDSDDGVIVINGSGAVAGVAKEISGEERLSWVLVLSGSQHNGQGSAMTFQALIRL